MLDDLGPQGGAGDVADEGLDGLHHGVVVAVGLVGLEHGELGVVAAGEALVAEVASDLEDLVDAADEEALEVELEGDAEVELAAEGVVPGLEGLGGGSARDGLHHGRLDLDVAPAMEEGADFADDGGPEEEGVADVVVGDEVQVALPVADLGVLEAVPLAGRRAQGLGKDDEGVRLDGGLAGARAEQGPGDADEVREVEVLEDVEGVVAEGLLLGVHLDAAGDVLEVHELGLAHVAVGGDAAGDADGRALLKGAVLEGLAGGAAARAGRELVAEGIDAPRLKRGELGPSLLHQCVRVFHVRRPHPSTAAMAA